MDQDEEEREHGVTINVAKANFQTASNNITVLDCPGHRDFITNMIQGASQADAAILVLNARKGAYEQSIERGETRSHSILARAVGVNQLVVAVNQLDIVEWDEARYDFICADVLKFLERIGYKEDKITFVPVSGLLGLNLDTRDTQPE